jgi:hypothetical protein
MAGTVTVIVVVVPGASRTDVLKGGILIVVADGKRLGGKTKRQGALH